MIEKIEAHQLKKQYGGRQVVQGVSLNVEQGEIVGLLGANGAGKTTTFYMVVGLVKADEGNVLLNGEDITKNVFYQRARMGVGYLPQEASIFREMSVEENIQCVAEVRKLSRLDKKSTVNRLIEEFNLGHVRSSLGRELSGGERRRVEIARALALDPKFVLLDEPFAGVDPLAVSDIQGIIQGLKKRGIGVLITDHSVRETLGIVDRAYVMNKGEVLVEGEPEKIVNSEVAKKMYLGEEFSM